MLRRVLLAFGVVFGALGLVVAASPSVTTLIRLPQVPLVFLGGLALVLGFSAQAARKRVEFRDADDASVRAARLEGRFEPPRPGEAIDAEFDTGSGAAMTGAQSPRLGERLRILAVRVIVDTKGCSKREAHRRIDAGTWTEDRTAAALFADDIAPPATGLLGDIFGYESTYEREIRHALDELKRMAGVDAGGE